MNRMPSQWIRGGAFFCLSDPSLHDAFKKIIKTTDKCSQKHFFENLVKIKELIN